MEYKFHFKVGDSVIVQDHTDENLQEQGIVDRIDSKDFKEPYRVSFSDSAFDYDWYGADKLQLAAGAKTVCKPSEVLEATQVSTEGKQAVVEAPVASEGRKYDSGKPRYSLLPSLALEEVVHVLTFGSQKYEDFNWMKVQNANDRYFSAANRHLWQWKRGEIMDSETKRHHLASAITNLMFILELELKGDTK